MVDALSFISTKSLLRLTKSLYGSLRKLSELRYDELVRLDNVFGDSKSLAAYYIEPNYQNSNPADESEYSPYIARSSIYKFINSFFSNPTGYYKGDNTVIILADAGMGKTSILRMIKLNHIFSFVNPGFDCTIMKLGNETLLEIKKIPNPSKTVLLLDSLDEDPCCWEDGNTAEGRLSQIVDATQNFKNVIITCRTQFFPDDKNTVKIVSDKVMVQGFKCQLIYLSLFDKEQISEFLIKRYFKNLHRFFIRMYMFGVSFREKKEKFSDFRIRDYFNPFKLIYRGYYEAMAFPVEFIRVGSVSNFVSYADVVRRAGTLSLRPFLLNHIKEISLDSKLENSYQIYSCLLDSWLNREVTKLYKKYNLQIDKMELNKACVFIAYKMFKDGRRSLSIDEISALLGVSKSKKFINVQSIVNGINLVDISSNSYLNKNSENQYRFSHLSIMEFLVAYGLDSEIIEPDVNVFLPYTDFMLDLLSSSNIYLSKSNCISIRRDGADYVKKFKLIKESINLPIFQDRVILEDVTFIDVDFNSSVHTLPIKGRATFVNCKFNSVTLDISLVHGGTGVVSFDKCIFKNSFINGSDQLRLTIGKSVFYKSDIFCSSPFLSIKNIAVPFKISQLDRIVSYNKPKEGIILKCYDLAKGDSCRYIKILIDVLGIDDKQWLVLVSEDNGVFFNHKFDEDQMAAYILKQKDVYTLNGFLIEISGVIDEAARAVFVNYLEA